MSVILAADYASLSDGATVATDASLAETFYLRSGRTSRTMSNPTNPTTGQTISYVIENSGGRTQTSWGTAFALAGAWTDAGSDRARSVTFVYNGTTWVEQTRTGWDLKVSTTPDDIASLVAWWDTNSLSYSDGDEVVTWTGRSGPTLLPFSIPPTPPTYKENIQNGLPVVRFDGLDDFLGVANPLHGFTNCSIFAVFAKADTLASGVPNGYRALVDVSGTGIAGGVFFEQGSAANTTEWDYGTGSSGQSLIASSVGTAFHQWSVIHTSGGTPHLYKDNGSAMNGAVTASTNFTQANIYVGSHSGDKRFLYGDLAELLLYSTPLGDPDRATVQTYLKNKWGTP